jgi:hypothetical protein
MRVSRAAIERLVKKVPSCHLSAQRRSELRAELEVTLAQYDVALLTYVHGSVDDPTRRGGRPKTEPIRRKIADVRQACSTLAGLIEPLPEKASDGERTQRVVSAAVFHAFTQGGNQWVRNNRSTLPPYEILPVHPQNDASGKELLDTGADVLLRRFLTMAAIILQWEALPPERGASPERWLIGTGLTGLFEQFFSGAMTRIRRELDDSEDANTLLKGERIDFICGVLSELKISQESGQAFSRETVLTYL